VFCVKHEQSSKYNLDERQCWGYSVLLLERYFLKSYGLLQCDIIMIFTSVKLCVKKCWRKHSVLELIFNFLLLPVSSFILQIPRMMNYRKRLIAPSFLWQFWAKLPGLLVSAVKFIARASRYLHGVSKFHFVLSWNIMVQIGKQQQRGLHFTWRARVLSSTRWPLTSSLRITAAVSNYGSLYTTYKCPLKHEMTLNLFLEDNCSCFRWWFSFRILYHFLSLFFMFLFLLKYILHLFHCCSQHPNYPRFLRKMWTLKICFHVLLDLSKGA
jgi:hypothetical protein